MSCLSRTMEPGAYRLGERKIAIIGSGMIGRQWSLLFASGGFAVAMYDIEKHFIETALVYIREELTKLEADGLLKGKLTAEEQQGLVSGSCNLVECLDGAEHVQECVPEDVELKKKVFRELDCLATDNMVLASSTSCIMASRFSEDLKHRSQVIVAHPVNPPYFLPLVEISPAPWTDANVVSRTRSLMEYIGQAPITLNKEVPGFALNRIQYAIINESWRLVQDGILSVQDVDTVMKAGLGPRYAFLGPLETCHLNADGMLNYCERYGETIYDISQTMGPTPKMTGPAAQLIENELCKDIPLEQIPAKRIWRDEKLGALARFKSKMN